MIIIVTVWVGGFALLAASSVTSNVAGGILGVGGISAAVGLAPTGVIPALAGLGLLGTAGAGMALAECMRPVLCVAASGQCCLSIMSRRGIECPPSCWDIKGQYWLLVVSLLLLCFNLLYSGLIQTACMRLHFKYIYIYIHIYILSNFI